MHNRLKIRSYLHLLLTVASLFRLYDVEQVTSFDSNNANKHAQTENAMLIGQKLHVININQPEKTSVARWPYLSFITLFGII